MSLTHFLVTTLAAGSLSVLTAPVDIVPPDDLVIDRIAGLDVTETLADLDAAGLAAARPGALDHLEPGSPAWIGLVATVRTWQRDGIEITTELVRSIDVDAAEAVVDQAAALAVALGLAAADPVFVGAWSYSGTVDGRDVAVTAWNQGPYSVAVSVRSDVGLDRRRDRAINNATTRQVRSILDRTGAAVADDAAIDDKAPTRPTRPAGSAVPDYVDSDVDSATSRSGLAGILWPESVVAVVALAGIVGAFRYARRSRRPVR